MYTLRLPPVSKKTINMTPLCKSPLQTMYTLRLPPASTSTIRMSPLCKLLLRAVSKKTLSMTPQRNSPLRTLRSLPASRSTIQSKSPLRTMYTFRLPPAPRNTIMNGPFMHISTDPVKGSREMDHNSKSRKTRRKRWESSLLAVYGWRNLLSISLPRPFLPCNS